MVINLLQMVEN